MSEPRSKLSDFGDAAIGLLPHRGPARLVTAAIETGAEFMVCTARFPSDNAMVSNGRVATYLTVEPAAQTAAVHLAALALDRNVDLQELSGFLTSVKNLTIHRPWLPAETELRVAVKPRGHARGLSKYLFEIHLHDALVCEGELSSFVQNELKS